MALIVEQLLERCKSQKEHFDYAIRNSLRLIDGIHWDCRETSQAMEILWKWLSGGLVAGVTEDLTVNQASLLNVCRFNLACKVQKIRVIHSYVAILTVADGTICRYPLFTMNERNQSDFKTMSRSIRGVDIIVVMTTDALKHFEEEEYIKLHDVQMKHFSFKQSKLKECIMFKVDGRFLSYDTLKGNDRDRIMRLLNDTEEQITTEVVSVSTGNKLPVSQKQTHAVDYSIEQHYKKKTVCDKSRELSTNIFEKHLDNSVNIQNRSASSSSKSGESKQSTNRKRLNKNLQKICLQPPTSDNSGIMPLQISDETAQSHFTITSDFMSDHNRNNSGTNNEYNSEDEGFIVEKRAVVRALKYLPGVYRVNVWIKDVSPSLIGSPFDLVIARCSECKVEQRYSVHKKKQQLAEMCVCSSCSKDGSLKFLDIQFNFTLILWDASDREISAIVTGEHAERFLKCTAYRYVNEIDVRKHVWTTLRKLKDRGCSQRFRCADDIIEVDIGVTVERGIKKYILFGGMLKNPVS